MKLLLGQKRKNGERERLPLSVLLGNPYVPETLGQLYSILKALSD